MLNNWRKFVSQKNKSAIHTKLKAFKIKKSSPKMEKDLIDEYYLTKIKY
jgi:hypothetical protein